MANQISYSNIIINMTINNSLFFKNQNNINVAQKKVVNYFPGNNNRRINIIFQTQSEYKFNIAAPINIRVKDLLLASAKEMGLNPELLGKEIFFLFNGVKIRINEEKDLISYGLEDTCSIFVLDFNNIRGGNSNF